ncbi:aminoglycoside N(3)-acetyltransferase [Rhizocola hellebori]|nr:AAC(3) family N-acetyltransferase [Rhizocola hellebori]
MVMSCPHTRLSLREDLRSVGVEPGQTLLLHASLRSLGYVCGGPVAVVQALLDALGDSGTLVVPTQTADNRDPSSMTSPAIPQSWWPAIREHMPAFDPAVTPSRNMGVIAETVRTWPSAVRSAHPQTSFAAIGYHAVDLMARHDLDSELGEASPLKSLEEAGASVLLLGVSYDKCTAFHLAEYRLPSLNRKEKSCAVLGAQGRQWVSYLGVDLDATSFDTLGMEFERKAGPISVGKVGAATARLFPIGDAVAFALDWLLQHRVSVGP